MLTRTRFLVLFFVIVLIVIVGALVWEELSGPTFRADAYDSHAQCMANIPAEWVPGSIERTRAESSCDFVHLRR